MKKVICMILLIAAASLSVAQNTTERNGFFSFCVSFGGGASGQGGSFGSYEGDETFNFHNSNLVAGKTMNFAVEGLYHFPLGKMLGLNVGASYRLAYYNFNNCVTYDETVQGLVSYIPQSYCHDFNQLMIHTIQVPIFFAITTDQVEEYIGVRPGVNFTGKLYSGHYSLDGDQHIVNETSKTSVPFGVVNPFSCELVLGLNGIPWNHKVTQILGFELYFNMMPTFIALPDGEKRLHEFGFALKI